MKVVASWSKGAENAKRILLSRTGRQTRSAYSSLLVVIQRYPAGSMCAGSSYVAVAITNCRPRLKTVRMPRFGTRLIDDARIHFRLQEPAPVRYGEQQTKTRTREFPLQTHRVKTPSARQRLTRELNGPQT